MDDNNGFHKKSTGRKSGNKISESYGFYFRMWYSGQIQHSD
nr:MAG TPA: hypothetical protein [Caudoviricetes sp.]